MGGQKDGFVATMSGATGCAKGRWKKGIGDKGRLMKESAQRLHPDQEQAATKHSDDWIRCETACQSGILQEIIAHLTRASLCRSCYPAAVSPQAGQSDE